MCRPCVRGVCFVRFLRDWGNGTLVTRKRVAYHRHGKRNNAGGAEPRPPRHYISWPGYLHLCIFTQTQYACTISTYIFTHLKTRNCINQKRGLCSFLDTMDWLLALCLSEVLQSGKRKTEVSHWGGGRVTDSSSIFPCQLPDNAQRETSINIVNTYLKVWISFLWQPRFIKNVFLFI